LQSVAGFWGRGFNSFFPLSYFMVYLGMVAEFQEQASQESKTEV
jgi:hypothetical protein